MVRVKLWLGWNYGYGKIMVRVRLSPASGTYFRILYINIINTFVVGTERGFSLEKIGTKFLVID